MTVMPPGAPNAVKEVEPLASSFGHLGSWEPEEHGDDEYEDDMEDDEHEDGMEDGDDDDKPLCWREALPSLLQWRSASWCRPLSRCHRRGPTLPSGWYLHHGVEREMFLVMAVVVTIMILGMTLALKMKKPAGDQRWKVFERNCATDAGDL